MRARTQFRIGPFMLSGWLWLVLIPLVVILCCCGVSLLGMVAQGQAPEPVRPSATVIPAAPSPTSAR